MSVEGYEFYRDGMFYAGFVKGDKWREEGRLIDRTTIMLEYDACRAHWDRPGRNHMWELRIVNVRRKK